MSTYSDPLIAYKDFELGEHNYDLLLIDYNMPNMNGAEFIEKISKLNYFGYKNIAIFSSIVRSNTVVDELKSKVQNYKDIKLIEKNISNLSVLKSEIQKLMIKEYQV